MIFEQMDAHWEPSTCYTVFSTYSTAYQTRLKKNKIKKKKSILSYATCTAYSPVLI